MAAKRIFFFLVTLISGFYAFADPEWVLKKEKDGIRVYTAAVPGSDFRMVKAEMTIKANLSQVAALLSDVSRHPQWVYNIKEASILKRMGPMEFVYYSEVSAPWPASNRDFVVNFKMSQPSPGILVIDSHCEQGMLPEMAKKVRVTFSISHWVITSQGDGTVKIDYSIQFDPAGSVPAWVINTFISDGPYKTFKNLRERVSLPEYSRAHFDFLKEK
jgi:ribosome-associated toxin RatA of RatAB toxin-antitoxin module